ncbi:MAG: [LysW]-lysine hydrolase [Chloroflexota bacterium]|nr:[LysW]-lysine hydrolase [Chloroflexota bacterium]
MRAANSQRRPAPDDEEAIAFLRDIVSIYSPSERERLVAEHIVGIMREWGYRAEIDQAGNAVGRMGDGERQILLLGHIDTVRGEIPVRTEDGVLYGRGSVDAKGPFAAFVVAAARTGALFDTLCDPSTIDTQSIKFDTLCDHTAIDTQSIKPNTQITVVGAVEEEAATSKGAYHVAEHHKRPDYIVIGEPSAWNRITIAYKGRLLVDYTLERPMFHTAASQRSACEQAVAFWLCLQERADDYNEDKERHFTTFDPSLRSIHSSSDGLTERVEMRMGLRLPPGFSVQELIAEMDRWRGDAQVKTWAYEKPFRASTRNALVSAFRAAIRAEGGRATYVSKTGTSDMNVLGPRWSCPIVAYGPGDSHLDHTPNEHLPLDEYLRAIRVLERVLRRLGRV